MTRRYVVTGAASGIGRASVERLRGQGHHVIGVDITSADINVDLSVAQGRDEMTQAVTALCDGRVDAVLAVAGTTAPTAKTVGVNYFGAVRTLELLRPLLAESDAPRAAVVSSLAALAPVDDKLLELLLAGDETGAKLEVDRIGDAVDAVGNNPMYKTTKRALSLWIRKNASAPEWAGAGIPLNAVAPGTIRTPMTEYGFSSEAGREIFSGIPLSAPAGNPEAVAAALDFLTSVDNSFATGQVLYVDGGIESVRRPEIF